MTKQELTQKFDMLYNLMATSNNPKYMRTFGDTMRHMMAWLIENKQDIAENYIESLCSIKWRQYLMQPKAAWDLDTWLRAMEAYGLETEQEGIYNRYALWTVMNAVYSDHGEIIASLLRLQPTDVANKDFVATIHQMALNLLLDQDGKYCVRCYFLGHC